jgi:hypothetical protein
VSLLVKTNYADFLVNSFNFIITATKAIVTIPVINPSVKSMNPVTESVVTDIRATANIPVKKPTMKITNPKTRKPP